MHHYVWTETSSQEGVVAVYHSHAFMCMAGKERLRWSVLWMWIVSPRSRMRFTHKRHPSHTIYPTLEVKKKNGLISHL